MSLAQGSHVVCLPKFDAADWLKHVEKYRPSFAYVVPTMMSRIAKLPEAQTRAADLSSIKTLIHMAAPCPLDIKHWWIDRLGAEIVLEIYGGTERIGATMIDGQEWLDHPGSVGKAFSNYEIVITNVDREELPVGEIGDIYFRNVDGPGAAYDYIGAETRIQGELDSFGDMGWVDEQGYLYIADRRTDMVTIGGANVFPAEVEAALETLPHVVCAAVIGLPDEDMGNRLHAIVEISTDQKQFPNAEQFIASAREILNGLKRPKSVEFTHDRIRDDAGKVRRARLRAERIQR